MTKIITGTVRRVPHGAPYRHKMNNMSMQENNINVQYAITAEGLPGEQEICQWVGVALKGRREQAELVVRIVDEAEITALNRSYRGKVGATNVLSFPVELPAGLPAEIRQSQMGDLLICAPVVAREASEQHRPETDHWAHLTIHGVLHLLGYDHEQADEAGIMESLETEIIAGLGIPDPSLVIA